jgi:hypothetical protein
MIEFVWLDYASVLHFMTRINTFRTENNTLRKKFAVRFYDCRPVSNYANRALVPHIMDGPADLVVLVGGLESDQPELIHQRSFYSAMPLGACFSERLHWSAETITINH